MTGHNEKGKKGFAGLSDLTSEITGIDEPINSRSKPKPKPEVKPSNPRQSSQSGADDDTFQSERKAASSGWGNETVNSDGSNEGSGNKWLLGMIGVIFVFWLINSDDLGNKNRSYTTPAASSSSIDENTSSTVELPSYPKSDELKYTTPSVGTNNVLSIPELRWCTRENIKIGAMKAVIRTNEQIEKFNQIVSDYNSRCGSYRYREGSLSIAKREVEALRKLIVAEAMREANQWDSGSQTAATESSKSTSASDKPNSQNTRVAQLLLTELGYEPGPVDGDYGRQTAEAVRAFQRDAGLNQDGWIDYDLLIELSKTKAARPAVASQPKSQSKSSSLPPYKNDTFIATKPESLTFEEQSKQSAAQRLARIGHHVDWRTNSLSDMLDAEARIGVANRLARLGHNVDWQQSSLSEMLDAEARIGVANRLARLGHNVNWRTSSLSDMLDSEARISAANRLKRKGISVNWQDYTLMQLLSME